MGQSNVPRVALTSLHLAGQHQWQSRAVHTSHKGLHKRADLSLQLVGGYSNSSSRHAGAGGFATKGAPHAAAAGSAAALRQAKHHGCRLHDGVGTLTAGPHLFAPNQAWELGTSVCSVAATSGMCFCPAQLLLCVGGT